MARYVCHLEVLGDPKPQPRPRAFALHGKARVYDLGTAEGWKGLVGLQAEPQKPSVPLTGPIAVTITFYFRRPKSHFISNKTDRPLKQKAPTYHTNKPDRDNLEKAVLDALKVIGMWRDDCQVCEGGSASPSGTRQRAIVLEPP